MNIPDFYKTYIPITAQPFEKFEEHIEIAPCDALKPFIRCFWGSKKPYIKKGNNSRLIIPDTCMDIVFNVDYTDNRISNHFCGIDDAYFISDYTERQGRLVSAFGIRFYSWGAIVFAEEDIRSVKNGFFDAEQYFPKLKRAIEPRLFDAVTIADRIKIAEEYLLKKMHPERLNTTVLTALDMLIQRKGNVKIDFLARDLHISKRQLERLFREYMSIAPKSLSTLIRYQCLWQELLFNGGFNALDAVEKYGYTDQSHLLKEFRKYHSMTITDAKTKALKDVAFLQDK